MSEKQSLRDKHTFEFPASVIAQAAAEQARRCREQVAACTTEYHANAETVKKTGRVAVGECRGGLDVTVVYDDDGAAYKRMYEAWSKARDLRVTAEQFEIDAQVYGTQDGRVYEMTPADVQHYHLGDKPA
jgi:hypothetical protein